MHIILESQIGRNIEAYIDGIVVKSKKCGDLFDDLKEIFDNLLKYKMILNPKKYVFGMSSGKLLGYMILSRGIDANPTKVEAIKKLQPLRTRREIQKLIGMMADSPHPIHLQVGRIWYVVLQAVTQGRWILVA
jgi:hypothetical protein